MYLYKPSIRIYQKLNYTRYPNYYTIYIGYPNYYTIYIQLLYNIIQGKHKGHLYNSYTIVTGVPYIVAGIPSYKSKRIAE